MRIPRGKNRDIKDRWYDKSNVWKHCHLKGCTLKKKSRFKNAYRKHCWKYHQNIDLEPEQQMEKLYKCTGIGCKQCEREGLEEECKC